MRGICVFLMLLSFGSCMDYFRLNKETTDTELYRIYKMKAGIDTLEFGAYFDYYSDTVVLDMVYLNKNEINHLQKSNMYKKGKPMLFLHNNTDFYINIFGLYYSDYYLTEIKSPKMDYDTIPLTQGKGFHYKFHQKPISDFYIPYKGGILRFIAVGDPNVYKSIPERFYREVDYMFFVLNSECFRLKPE